MIKRLLLLPFLSLSTIVNLSAQDAWHDENTVQSSADTRYQNPQDGIVRIGLLLPFIEGSKSVSQEKMTEYYEGFLLAVQRMKERELNAEIYTFDIGPDEDTRRLESILGTNELNNLNLIIGGVTDNQVKIISNFSKRTGIKYVVPFSNRNTGIKNNPYMFQIANAHANLYPKIAQGFIDEFRDYNIIFLNEQGSNKNKADFVDELERWLKANNIPYKTTASSASITDDLTAVVDRGRKNVIIPTSSSENTLNIALEAITVLSKTKTDISLFGYPEWQAYVNKFHEMHVVNTYIFSMFYLDVAQADARLFEERYMQWYNKTFAVSIPRYAHMGYDTGMTFMSALQESGNDFASQILQLRTSTLQSALHFEAANENGGYINTGMYFIHLKPDQTVDKIEISRQ